MKRRAVCGLCLVGVLLAAPAAAQFVTADALSKFVDESLSPYRHNPSPDWEDTLYAIAKSERSPDTVLAEFARRMRVSPDVARVYATVIVESVVDDETCQAARVRPARCAFAPGQPRYERAASAGLADATGNLLVIVSRSKPFTRWDQAAVVTLARKHRAATTIFSAMYDWRADPAHLMALMASGRRSDHEATLAARKHRWESSWSRQDDALRLAMLEGLEQSAATQAASTESRAALAQWALSLKLKLRLADAALEGYYAYPAAIRNLLPNPMQACLKVAKDCSEVAEAGYALADELAAALWTAGHEDDAQRLLQTEIADLGTRSAESLPRYQALSEAIAPAHRKEDLYPLFIDGHLPGQSRPQSWVSLTLGGGSGWLFTVRNSGSAVRHVVAGRLRAAGHDDMAAYLEEADWSSNRGNADPVLSAVAAMFPPAVQDRQSYWDRRLEKVATPVRDTVTDGPVRVSIRDLPAWWDEQPLPESIPAWRQGDPAQTPPDGASLPVDRNAVVRYEDRNGERAVVYLSSEYDLSGETPAFGIWFARTIGGAWAAPLYLGLQQHYPYVVTPGSRMPLLDGNRLRLEVQVREIDSTTITFPPLSLDLKRSVDGLFLDFDLATLGADRDGDGLTDIEERRLGLDFTNADTDGDSVPDARDPLPLVPYRASSVHDDALARALVSEIFGRQPVPIVVQPGRAPTIDDIMAGARTGDAVSQRTRTRFLVGRPSMFAGVATPFRLIVYSPQDVEALNRGSAPFYPARIAHTFSSLDGTRHFVEWSASWTGGSFMVTCATPDRPCSVQAISTWIS